jgi:UDP-glucose 4-epimerase
VVDVADAHVKALEFLQKQPRSSFYKVYNLGTGEGVSVLQLIEKFQKVTGVKLNYTVGTRRPGDVEKVYADPSKIIKELNWKAKYSIEDGLKHSWEWEKKLTR